MFHSILVVCVGNICRSPFAAEILRVRCPSMNVESAGLSALVGSNADATAKRIAGARGVDLSGHSGTQVSSRLVDGADIILVMEDEHLAKLYDRFPRARGKAFKLGKFLGEKNIADPYRKSDQYFELVYDEIEEAIASWLPRL